MSETENPNKAGAEAEQLSNSLAQLAAVEQQIGAAEREVEIFRIKRTQSIYAQRRAITSAIPQFWYIVLAQNDDFGDYVRAEDLKYLDHVNDIYVHFDVAENDAPRHYRDFSISVLFHDAGGAVPTQTVTKRFHVTEENGEESILSEAVAVQWPEDLAHLCPATIRANKSGDYTSDEKKRYRAGMKSFFAWFEWTGRKPTKEFRAGEDLTRLILDDLFPNAVKYYAEALQNDDHSDEDSLEGEELDLSDAEPEAKRRKAE